MKSQGVKDENNTTLGELFSEFLKTWQTTQLIRPEEAFAAFKAGYDSAHRAGYYNGYKDGYGKCKKDIRFVLSPAPHNNKGDKLKIKTIKP